MIVRVVKLVAILFPAKKAGKRIASVFYVAWVKLNPSLWRSYGPEALKQTACWLLMGYGRARLTYWLPSLPTNNQTGPLNAAIAHLRVMSD